MFLYVQDPQKKQSAYIHFCVWVKMQQKPATYNSIYAGFFKNYRFLQEKKYIGILYFCPKDSASLL